MSTRISLPKPVWSIIGDCLAAHECANTLDKVLKKNLKSDRFKLKVKAENDKNLRIFWDALRTYAYGRDWKPISLHTFFTNFSDCLDPQDVKFGIDHNRLEEDSPDVVDSIRRIVNNPIVQQNLFPTVINFVYHGHEGPPTMLRKELNGFINLEQLTLRRTVLANGLGTFATPLDLRELPRLSVLQIDNSNLQDEDLLLSHKIFVQSRWSFDQKDFSYKVFFPSLTTFAGWKARILDFCSFLSRLIGRFCEWLCDLCY